MQREVLILLSIRNNDGGSLRKVDAKHLLEQLFALRQRGQVKLFGYRHQRQGMSLLLQAQEREIANHVAELCPETGIFHCDLTEIESRLEFLNELRSMHRDEMDDPSDLFSPCSELLRRPCNDCLNNPEQAELWLNMLLFRWKMKRDDLLQSEERKREAMLLMREQSSLTLAEIAAIFEMPTEKICPFLYGAQNDLTTRALGIATRAHQGQTDKDGKEYLHHPLYLASQLEREEEVQLALLHDVLEDSPIPVEELRAAGFSEEVLEALLALTHDEHEPYMDYIHRLKHNALARKIKILDLKHNLDPSRISRVTPRDRTRWKKYREALKILEKH